MTDLTPPLAHPHARTRIMRARAPTTLTAREVRLVRCLAAHLPLVDIAEHLALPLALVAWAAADRS